MKQRSGEIIYVESKLGSMRMTNVLAFLLTRRMPAVNNIMVDMVETSDCSNNHICWRVVQKTVEILVCQGQGEEYEQIIKVSLRSPCSPLDFSDQLENILVQNKGYFSRRKTELIMGPCAKHADKTFAPKISIFIPKSLPNLGRQTGMPIYPEYKLPDKIPRAKRWPKIKAIPEAQTEEQSNMNQRKFPDTFVFTEARVKECYEAILAIIKQRGCEESWPQISVVALDRDLGKIAKSKNLSSAYYHTYLNKLKKLGVIEDGGYQSDGGWRSKITLVHWLDYELQGQAPLLRRVDGPTMVTPPTETLPELDLQDVGDLPAPLPGGVYEPIMAAPPRNDARSSAGTCPQPPQLELQNLSGLGDKLKPLGEQILSALGAQGISFRRNDQGITEIDVSY